MTTQDLTRIVLPYARHALTAARPAVINVVGRAGWIVVWPAWAMVVGPLLPLLVRIGVELAVGLAAPSLLPLLEMINALASYVPEGYLSGSARAFLAELLALLKTPRATFSQPVREALAMRGGWANPAWGESPCL
jgi:hypothetical protein